MDDNIIAGEVRRLREANNLSQRELARLLGAKPSAVSNWETGLNRPGLSHIVKMCGMFSVSADEFLGINRSGDIGAVVGENELKSDESGVNGEKSGLSDRKHGLSDAETALVGGYRRLDGHGRAAVMNTLKFELTYRKYLPNNTADAGGKAVPSERLTLPFFDARASAGTGEFLSEGGSVPLEVASTPETLRADFIIAVNGDSMEPEYSDGDLLLVERTEAVGEGEEGIFTLNGEGFFKVWGSGRLLSYNRAYAPLKVREGDDLRCAGRVIGRLETKTD